MDKLSAKTIKEYLKYSNLDVSVFESVTSTNTLLKEQANEEKEGKIIIADSQTSGRGRLTRSFYSPEGCGIYMSILLKPTLSPENSVLITAAAASAVAKAVENLTHKKADIKWVNDVLLNEKKVCGILTEGSINVKTGAFDWAVVGIGINAYKPQNGYPEDIKDIAGAVFHEKADAFRNRLAAEIINLFWEYYLRLSEKSFLASYKNHSIAIGKQIDVIKGESVLTATALDIDDNCRLLVRYENGETEYISSGEISIKLKK